MASVIIQNPPTNLTMQDFRSVSDAHGGLAKSARFVTRITPTGSKLIGQGGVSSAVRDLMYLCEIVDMPGRGLNVAQDITYYGPNLTLPFQTVYNELDMTFLCRTYSGEREFFDNWMNLINPSNTYNLNYRDEYRADIDIFQFGEAPLQSQSVISKDPEFYSAEANAPEAHYNITVHDAWPMQVHQQPMTWADDGFQRLVVTFSYYRWSRKGLDPVARTNGPRGGSFSLVDSNIPGSSSKRDTGGF